MKELPAIKIYQNQRGLIEVDINAASDWDSFDKLVEFLKINYSARVLSSTDGIGERFWKLIINEAEVIIEHDDFYGNVLKANEPCANKIVEDIGNDLMNRFS